jgi:large subunit ribosomal protein L17
MRHAVAGRKLKRTASHRKAMMRNMVTSLFEHKKIHTTEAKAKELRPFAEQLITKAKHALSREKQGLLPDGMKIDVHTRRIVGRLISKKAVLQELFDAIAPVVEARAGGYCRIVKTGIRRGDAGRTAIIELVDWSAPVDGATNMKKRRAGKAKPKVPVSKTSGTKISEEVETISENQLAVDNAEVNLISEENNIADINNEDIEIENVENNKIADVDKEIVSSEVDSLEIPNENVKDSDSKLASETNDKES